MDNSQIMLCIKVFKNAQGQEILSLNTSQQQPYLFNQNNLLYTSFNPNNPKLSPGEGASTREEILNTEFG